MGECIRISEKITDTTADGRVYKAQAKETRESCVLKLVYKAAGKEQLYRELDVLNKVKHPNVLLLLRACSVPADNFEFVMALPEADTDIRCMLARREGHRVGVSLVEILAAQIVQGLDALHTKQVLHRDLKPANILTYLDEDPMRVVIADLARAKRVPNRRAKKKLCNNEGLGPHTPMLGTAIYTAPELVIEPGVLLRELEYGRSADVWSFGCILVERLAGRHLVFGNMIITRWRRQLWLVQVRLRRLASCSHGC